MKKTKCLISGLLISSLLSGCANFSYENPVKADTTTTYVAEYPDGSQVEITKEEAEEIKNIQEELGVTVEAPEREEIEEVEEPEIKEAFSINKVLGSEKEHRYSSLGVTYTIYEHGAEIVGIENDYAVIPEEIEYEGVTYPVVSLGESMLSYNQTTEFTIPSHIKYINARAFSASNIESLIIPDTIEYLSGCCTFQLCKNLKSVVFEGEFETDSEWFSTFPDCSSLESIIIPEGVTRLYYICFQNCSNLTSVSLPNSLKIIDEGTFSYCKNLETVIIPNGVEVINGAFEHSGIKHIEIPESVTVLSGFGRCNELEELIIPDSVTQGGYGVSSDNLKVLKLSNNCEYDFSYGSLDTPKLELLIFPDNTEEIYVNFFQYVEDKSNLTIQVPEKTVQYFQNKFPEINVVAKE